jgi:hypothetical protein
MNEKEFKLLSQKWDAFLRLGQALIKFGTLAFVVWHGRLMLEALAGRQTLAKFGLSLMADLSANTAFSHIVMGIFGASGAGYGIRQRGLRRKDIKRLGNRVVELEKKLDTKRSSSGLTIDGRSRPEDEP